MKQPISSKLFIEYCKNMKYAIINCKIIKDETRWVFMDKEDLYVFKTYNYSTGLDVELIETMIKQSKEIKFYMKFSD